MCDLNMCVNAREVSPFIFKRDRLSVNLPADSGLFCTPPPLLLVSLPPVKIQHQCVAGVQRPTRRRSRLHKNITRVTKEEKVRSSDHLEKKRRGDRGDKHNKSQVSDNHSNVHNHQPSKQRLNKVWTNYMLVNPPPTSPPPPPPSIRLAHRENWVGSGWVANNDKLSVPAIILTVMIALEYFTQWWKWTLWAAYQTVPAAAGMWSRNPCPCKVVLPSCSLSSFIRDPYCFSSAPADWL